MRKNRGEVDVDAASNLRAEVQRLRREAAELRDGARDLARIDKARQRRLAVTAFAMVATSWRIPAAALHGIPHAEPYLT